MRQRRFILDSAVGKTGFCSGRLFSAGYLSVVLLVTLVCGCASHEPRTLKVDSAETIAVFPFENFSDDEQALSMVIPALTGLLKMKGVNLAVEEDLDRLLIAERVRYSGYVPRGLAGKMRSELNVAAVLTGAVVSFSSEGNPRVGVLARLIDTADGRIRWAGFASATGDDFATVLGLGRITTMDALLPRVLDMLLSSFTTEPPLKEKESTYTIAVLPFLNRAEQRGAGMIASYLFVTELVNDPLFIPFEFGDVRKTIVDLRVRSRGEIDFATLSSLAEALNVDLVLVGTVEVYPKDMSPSVPPEAAISSRLLNVREKKIVWAGSSQLNGDESITAFEWGKVRSPEGVAAIAVSRLTERMHKATWQ